jgi:hypothetical protein
MRKNGPESGGGPMDQEVLRLCCALCVALLLLVPHTEAQSGPGFASNGIHSASFQAQEHTNSSAAAKGSQTTALNSASVPASALITVSQVNWLAALSGQMLISESPAGTSFGINANGLLAVADTSNLVLLNTQTGVSSTLAWPSASAVAIDPANNIYVSVLYGSVTGIVKLPYTGGTSNNGYAAFSTSASGMATCTAGGTVLCKLPGTVGDMLPGAMAFDASGTLFLTTSIGSTLASNSIWKCTAACLNGRGLQGAGCVARCVQQLRPDGCGRVVPRLGRQSVFYGFVHLHRSVVVCDL